MKVHVTLYNAENIIRPCLEAVSKVYPDLQVHDFGSEDAGPEIVQSMNLPITYHGRLSGEDYVFLKEDISSQSDKVFWVDADEVWPRACLRNVSRYLQEYSVVNGFWRNLKIRDETVYLSDYIHRGAIAWDTRRFQLHRTWPREKLRCRVADGSREKEQVNPAHEAVYCYHGVLLNISTLPDKKNRWKKRAERDDQCVDLDWKVLKKLPFENYNSQLLSKPKFSWYK